MQRFSDKFPTAGTDKLKFPHKCPEEWIGTSYMIPIVCRDRNSSGGPVFKCAESVHYRNHV